MWHIQSKRNRNSADTWEWHVPHSDERTSPLHDGDNISHSTSPSAAAHHWETSLIVTIHHSFTKFRRDAAAEGLATDQRDSCNETPHAPGQVKGQTVAVGFRATASRADLLRRCSRSLPASRQDDSGNFSRLSYLSQNKLLQICETNIE